jgi:hypothetical protein
MTTDDDSPEFAEFVSLIEALPPDRRAAFNQCIVDFEAGMRPGGYDPILHGNWHPGRSGAGGHHREALI